MSRSTKQNVRGAGAAASTMPPMKQAKDDLTMIKRAADDLVAEASARAAAIKAANDIAASPCDAEVQLSPRAIQQIRRSITHGLHLAVQVNNAKVAHEVAEICKHPWPEGLTPVFPMEDLCGTIAPMAEALLWLEYAQPEGEEP